MNNDRMGSSHSCLATLLHDNACSALTQAVSRCSDKQHQVGAAPKVELMGQQTVLSYCKNYFLFAFVGFDRQLDKSNKQNIV